MYLNKIKSKLEPTINKNQALIISEAFGDLQKIVAITCFLNRKSDTIIVCQSIEEAKTLFDLAKYTFNITNSLYFPDFNLESYSKAASSKEINQTRIDTLYSLLNNKGAKLLITTTLAFIYKTITKEYLQTKQLSITISQKLSISDVLKFLIENG